MPALLRGEAATRPLEQLVAVSILRGEEFPIAPDELDLLLTLPSEWVAVDELEADRGSLVELASKGLLITDSLDRELAELRGREERLSAGQWNLHAALYHSLTRWHGLDIEAAGALGEEHESDDLAAFVERFGKPPGHFYSVADPLDVQQLPLAEETNALFQVLRERKTTRAFQVDVPLSLTELSALLYEVYGCQGYAPLAEGVAVLRKTSPSGGGMHPVEAFPLLIRVDGLEPGLYHYRTEDHALELIRALGEEEARILARAFTCGQSYFGEAQALVVMAARFPRSFWKYRQHEKAYAVLLMDCGHLSQTFYLVCAALGLGAFVTAAINNADVDEALGLDGFEQGSLAICGCGRPAATPSKLDAEFLPYVPRETRF